MSERRLLDRILEPGNLSVCFQPVLSLDGGCAVPHYFEALIRGPRGTTVESPAILFEYARNKSQESAVDRACVKAILGAAGGLPPGAVLGINVHASTLAMDEGFTEFLTRTLAASGRAAEGVVVEIVEHAPPWDVQAFRRVLDELRGLGARIALDDIGLGHSNFTMILDSRPDYFKIDRSFVHGCHADAHRRAVLASVEQLARAFDGRVIAEGIEEAADLATVRELGISLVQGYLFGMAVPVSKLRPVFRPLRARAMGARPAATAAHARR